jgi:hypothetical protein
VELANGELEGTALSVYTFIARADRPVGTREITRDVGLSSTSVAHYHLQKLETLDLIEKNSNGDYIPKKKAAIDGHVWVGKNLIPQLMLYSLFFLGVFVTEVSTIVLSLIIKSLVVETSFWFLTAITLVAMLLFIKEGKRLQRKLKTQNAQLRDKKTALFKITITIFLELTSFNKNTGSSKNGFCYVIFLYYFT